MHISSVAPGYTVDSNITKFPGVSISATIMLADLKYDRSGLLSSLTGVGTLTM